MARYTVHLKRQSAPRASQWPVQFLQEEGVTETLKKGTRVTGADRTKLASDLQKRYSAGESIRALAASTGRSYGFIHRILAESGVPLRSRGGATRGRAKG
jgi:Helix-turn-helix domain